MFGTVSRARMKEGVTVDQVKSLFARMQDHPEERPAGAVSLIVFQSVDDPREIWIASAFESRETYFKNADSPEQKARFERTQQFFEGPPEWHDGNVVVVAAGDRVMSAD